VNAGVPTGMQTFLEKNSEWGTIGGGAPWRSLRSPSTTTQLTRHTNDSREAIAPTPSMANEAYRDELGRTLTIPSLAEAESKVLGDAQQRALLDSIRTSSNVAAILCTLGCSALCKAIVAYHKHQVALGSNNAELKEAHAWYLSSARRGEAVAQHNLGTFYTHGLGVDRDHAVGNDWYQRAAKQGHTAAVYAVAEEILVRRDTASPSELARGLDHCKRAADAGHALAQHNYAVLLWDGVPDALPQDQVLALDYARRAVAQGHAAANKTWASELASGANDTPDGTPLAPAEAASLQATGGVKNPSTPRTDCSTSASTE